MSIRRKVIQVSLTESRDQALVAALCDDGTIWLWEPDEDDGKWLPLPRIPQTELPVPGRRS